MPSFGTQALLSNLRKYSLLFAFLMIGTLRTEDEFVDDDEGKLEDLGRERRIRRQNLVVTKWLTWTGIYSWLRSRKCETCYFWAVKAETLMIRSFCYSVRNFCQKPWISVRAVSEIQLGWYEGGRMSGWMHDFPHLADVLQIPEVVTSYQGTVSIEVLCILLKRVL